MTARTATLEICRPARARILVGVLEQVPVMAAAVGASIAFVGVILTQFLTSRREVKQWSRQLEQEQIRWERERQERQEQWEREDAARWEKDRYRAYADFLASVEGWIDVAQKEQPRPVLGRSYITDEGAARLRDAHAAIDSAEAMIELLAPESIRGKVRGVAVMTSFFVHEYGHVNIEIIGNEPSVDSDAALQRITRQHSNVRRLIRDDLGIERENEDGDT